MAFQWNILFTALGLLTIGLLPCLVNSFYSPSEPTERIALGTNFDELDPEFKYIKYSVGAVMIQRTLANNEVSYTVLCTATLISAERMISNGNCLRNAFKVEECDPFGQNRELVVAIGMDSTSTADVNKPNVVINDITLANLIFHPMYNASKPNTYDLVVIKLTKKANPPMYRPMFVARYLETKNVSELGYYTLSWGQPACTGSVNAVRNIALAPTYKDTLNKLPDKGDDQIVHQLRNTRTALNAYEAFGDVGCSVFLPQNDGNSTINFVIRSVVGVNGNQLLANIRASNPTGTSCSQESFIAATDLLNPNNYNFLFAILDKIPGDQMRFIYQEPIP